MKALSRIFTGHRGSRSYFTMTRSYLRSTFLLIDTHKQKALGGIEGQETETILPLWSHNFHLVPRKRCCGRSQNIRIAWPEIRLVTTLMSASGSGAGSPLVFSEKAAFGSESSLGVCWSPRQPPSQLSTCAVQRRRFPVGESPTRPTRSSRKQPERSWR